MDQLNINNANPPPNNVVNNGNVDPLHVLNAQVQALQQQLQQSNQMLQAVLANNLNNANHNLNNGLKVSKPDKFTGKNVRSWISSLENIFGVNGQNSTEQQKIQYAISFMADDAIQWWELMKLNEVELETFEEFKERLLEYFEPVNRENNARQRLSTLKQNGKYNAVAQYNQEFSKWLLKIPDMSVSDQLFSYKQGL